MEQSTVQFIVWFSLKSLVSVDSFKMSRASFWTWPIVAETIFGGVEKVVG